MSKKVLNFIKNFFSHFTFNVSRCQAFTLAEVLIVLGIIGVVSAITIPNLVKNYQEYTWHQAWKKEYSTIAQAYEQVKQDEGGDLSGYFNSSTHYSLAPIVEKMGQYLSVIKKCNVPNSGDYVLACGVEPPASLINAYETMSGAYLSEHNLGHGQFVLKNGAHYYFRPYLYVITLWVDVNGFNKQPNKVGKDLFGVSIINNKVLPMGASGTGLENSCKSTIINGTILQGFHPGVDVSGAGCSAEYLYK